LSDPAHPHRPSPPAILALASFFKGGRFLETAKAEGATVYLLTIEKLLSAAWPRASIDEVFALKESFQNRTELLNVVSFLARTRKIDRVVPMDDFDVEMAALIREHLRVPGMGETTARYFRDKLAMRERAHDAGILVPPFVPLLNHADIAHYLDTVPGPWVLKPRSEAGAIGIKKIHSREELWPLLDTLGDRAAHHLLEQMIPGDVYHVDSIVSERAIVFASCHRYRRPILGVVQGGGLFGSRTVPYDSDEERKLLAFHAETLSALGFVRGVAHTEFIKSQIDGNFYFLETGARVGGAHIADLVEAETDVDLWAEWARVEIPHGKWAYTAPKSEKRHAGLIVSLSKDKTPDMSGYADPDIVWKLTMDYHAGLVVVAPDEATLDRRMDELEARISKDFLAVLPPTDKATH
jgi:biotin carboxylase